MKRSLSETHPAATTGRTAPHQSFVMCFSRAGVAAWKFGGDVRLWATLNEPLVTVSQGFVSIPGVTGVKAPAVLSYTAALRALENLGLANAAAYDAIKAVDRRARVGFVHNMVAWRPSDPSAPRVTTRYVVLAMRTSLS